MRTVKKILRILIPLILLIFLVYEAKRNLKPEDLQLSLEALRRMSRRRIVFLLVLGLLVNAVKYFYDAFILHFYKLRLSRWSIFKAAILANNIGSLSGAGLRYAIYRGRLDRIDCLRVNVLVLMSSYLGLAGLNLFTLIRSEAEAGILNQYAWLKAALAFLVLLFPLFFMADRMKGVRRWLIQKSQIDRLPLELKLRLSAASFLDWGATALLFALITTTLSPKLRPLDILAAFSVASTVAALSYMPGGWGTFDYLAVVSLRSLGVWMHDALLIMALFRLFNTVIPVVLGLAINLPTLLRQGLLALKKNEP